MSEFFVRIELVDVDNTKDYVDVTVSVNSDFFQASGLYRRVVDALGEERE